MHCRLIALIATLVACACHVVSQGVQAQTPAPAPAAAPDIGATARQIQDEVAQLRGLSFKRPVEAKMQTQDEFGDYLDERVESTVPDDLTANYGKVVRKLGLYRGPEIDNAPVLMKSVVASQAAAYYDPKTSAFYVLTPNMPELAMGVLFAHELYHGLQDQYFNLDAYMSGPAGADGANNDRTLARQAVVEGEATYIMSMWMVKRMTGREPARQTMDPIVRLQTQMDMNAISQAMKQPRVAEALGPEFEAAINASKEIPPFIMDTMMGAYLKGLGFVFDVHAKGWSEVEKLYGDFPPDSTEQILHPDKWFAREVPLTIEFTQLERDRSLKDWTLLAQNTIGEFLWRTIFKEHGQAKEAESIAAGWDGDRYAVLQRKNGGDLLLLLNTAWDTEADAIEFAGAYQRLLSVKYETDAQPTRVQRNGKRVFIVEGGSERSLAALMKLTKKAQERRPKK